MYVMQKYSNASIVEMDGTTHCGILLRRSLDFDGYFVQAQDNPQKSAFIQKETRDSIVAGNEVRINI